MNRLEMLVWIVVWAVIIPAAFITALEAGKLRRIERMWDRLLDALMGGPVFKVGDRVRWEEQPSRVFVVEMISEHKRRGTLYEICAEDAFEFHTVREDKLTRA